MAQPLIKHMKKIFIILVFISFTGLAGHSQTKPGSSRISIYSYPMDPRQHPDDSRRIVKPPDSGTFGNRIQFMALRSLDGDYKKLLDQYTIKYGLGNIIWPSYPIIFREDLPEVVQELKKRNLYLFDIWGFVPGSGPGGYWQQFVLPEKIPALFEKVLGDHWLGMDNGEQDGRYVGGYASQMVPLGAGKEQQYLNFQNHFQGLTDRLGNKMSTLVSLNFGHYFLKEGIYTMIGAETAQGLPNTQIYYSFIRGAGKQYGVPWFGNASVWNRWGWKNYSGVSDYNGGDTKGTSLSLLKRLIYSHVMYNCVAVGFEASFLNGKDELSPVGKIQQSANRWVEKYGNPGNLYTPVAVMLDFFSGWSFPRHLYTDDIYKVWGNLPYDDGDYLTDGILNLLYPGYQDASFFHDETGFITQTPFGDAADCLLSDCPLWLMKQYPVIIIGSRLQGGHEIKDKLEAYVKSGGRLIITAGNIESIPDGLCGIKSAQKQIEFGENAQISVGGKNVTEKSGFKAGVLIVPADSKVLASSNNIPLAAEVKAGTGTVTVLASQFGISSKPGDTGNPGIDKNMKSPYALLSHVELIIGDIVKSTAVFNGMDGLSLITCRKGDGEYTVAISNNTWTEKPFGITSPLGKKLTSMELPIDVSERKATGFLPESVSINPGRNTGKTIAGGDIRIFRVKMDENNVDIIPFIQPVLNPVNRGLPLGDIVSVKSEILLRPAFFQHFDRITIDWKYLTSRENKALAEESVWIKNQGLKVNIDLSSGINLFPDIRIVNNDSAEFRRSMDLIRTVMEKMNLLGAGDLILTTHRTIETNFTDEQFSASLKSSLQLICQAAAAKGINIHLRMVPGKFAYGIEKARDLQLAVGESNFYIAPSLAMLAGDMDNLNKNLGILKELKYSILFIGAPEKDIFGKLWNMNLPLYKYGKNEELRSVLQGAKDKTLLLDGLYDNKDEEYLDIKNLNELTE
jgi:hypothetical protein